MPCLKKFTLFTALHGMTTRSSDCRSVRLSVRLSDKRVNCDKTEDKSVQIFTPYERSFSLVFSEREWLVVRPLTYGFETIFCGVCLSSTTVT